MEQIRLQESTTAAFEQARQALEQELAPLYERRQRLSDEMREVQALISERERLLASTCAALGLPIETRAVVRPVGDDERLPIELIEGLPRSGYGAATTAVLALITGAEGGATGRALSDALLRAGFHRDPVSSARSAVKNLSVQKKIVRRDGRYFPASTQGSSP